MAQNWSAAPTPVELPPISGWVKSFVEDVKRGTQSEQGYDPGAVGADEVNWSRHVARLFDVSGVVVLVGVELGMDDEGDEVSTLSDESLRVKRAVQSPMVRVARTTITMAMTHWTCQLTQYTVKLTLYIFFFLSSFFFFRLRQHHPPELISS